MIPEHLGNLPPRDIPEPKTVFKQIIRTYILAIVITPVLVLAVNHHSSGVIGATVSIGLLVTIIGVELSLILRAQDRRRAALMKDLPAGGFFAEKATLLPFGGQHRPPQTGTITFTHEGVIFSAKKVDGESFFLHWHDIVKIRLVAVPWKIGVGSLTLTLIDGSTRVFTVPRYQIMAQALNSQP